MKDTSTYFITAILAPVGIWYPLYKPLVFMIAFSYFPIERITRERKNPVSKKLVHIVQRFYIPTQLILTTLIYRTQTFNGYIDAVLFPSLYDTVIFQGFLMGYWNDNPVVGIVLNSALYVVPFGCTGCIGRTGMLLVVFIHALFDNIILERHSIQRICFSTIIIRSLVYYIF